MTQFFIERRVTSDEGGLLLRVFLYELQISRSAITDIKYHGGKIEVDGREKNVRRVLHEGEVVKVTFPKETPSEEMTPEPVPFQILYEDEYLLVVDKPYGVPTIPSNLHPTGTLANGILHYYKQIGLESTFHAVNRLDKDTSGAMIIAKHRYIHNLFGQKHRNKSIHRTYLALVHGHLLKKEGLVDAPIGRKSTSIIEREVREDGQPARTRYRVLEEYDNFSAIELELETGRTHQIRVHMSWLGHSLLGDDLYGGQLDVLRRQALHSRVVTFEHPITKEKLTFEAPIPEDMMRVMKKE